MPTGTTFEGTSRRALEHHLRRFARLFYVLSDDQSVLQPARFYTLDVDLSDGRLDNGDVDFIDVTTFARRVAGARSLDPEGDAARAGDCVTSGGIAAGGVAPGCR